MVKLVLFDIDGTLVNSSGIGRKSVTQAFYDILAIEDAFHGVDMAGKTDIQIVKQALEYHGVSIDDGMIPSVLSRYVEVLKDEVDKRQMFIQPGIMELLDCLGLKKDLYLGLLTGNIEQGGRIKIGRFDLNRYFPFGAFGDDNEDRNQLLPIAVEKFRALTGRKVEYTDCVVIGDTPLDVQCAKPYGACSIAVATGPFTVEKLRDTRADYVLEDLSGACKLDVFKSPST